MLSGAVTELRGGRPGLMTLVALAITTAYLYSLAITLDVVGGMPFYWELATLVTIILLGHWLEMRAVGNAQGRSRNWPGCCRMWPSGWPTVELSRCP